MVDPLRLDAPPRARGGCEWAQTLRASAQNLTTADRHLANPDIRDASHEQKVIDLYAIDFDPVFRLADFGCCAHETIPPDVLEQMTVGVEVLATA